MQSQTRAAGRPPVWVIVPTYNERENLEPLVEAVRSASSTASHPTTRCWSSTTPPRTARASSPIGSPTRSRTCASCTARASRGSGPPTWPASGRALAGGADLVFEMDADFSHDPSYLAPMIEAAAGADLVLGSRYVEGGAVRNWGRCGG